MLDEKKKTPFSDQGQEVSDAFTEESTVEMIDVIPEPPQDKDISLDELTARISADFEAHRAEEEAAAAQQEDELPEEIELAAPPRREISVADLAEEISAKLERRELAEKTVAAMEEKLNRKNSAQEEPPASQEDSTPVSQETEQAPTPAEETPSLSSHEEEKIMKNETSETFKKEEVTASTEGTSPSPSREIPELSEEEVTPTRTKPIPPSVKDEYLDLHAGEKYVDSQTKQHWEEEDNAFEERRKRRAEARLARQEELRKAKRRRNITIVAILLLACAAAFAFAWSQGFLNRGNGSQNAPAASAESPMETQTAETPTTEDDTLPVTQEASTEAVTTEAEFFDQSTEAGMEETEDYVESTNAAGISPADPVSFFDGYELNTQDAPEITDEEVDSPYAILVDLDTGEVIAQRGADTIISPASMTKILTVLVAAENLVQEDLDDTVTIDTEILDYVYQNGCSVVGFEEGEEVTVRDLFLGTILPSGADAALALAKYVAGSQEAFVRKMNEKLDRLGLSDTAHFTNCVGLYDEDHYCTVADMAMIMKAAAKDNYARKVLAAHVYTTTETDAHPDGLVISNWFLRRIEDRDTHGTVLCAKTGFVNESGNCAASYMVGNNGKNYVCVTAGTYSTWRCIYDHVQLYTDYVPE